MCHTVDDRPFDEVDTEEYPVVVIDIRRKQDPLVLFPDDHIQGFDKHALVRPWFLLVLLRRKVLQ